MNSVVRTCQEESFIVSALIQMRAVATRETGQAAAPRLAAAAGT
jgi:hypothetical protein